MVAALSVKAPLSVNISKNKKFILNLNNYRNAHYQTLNKAKIVFKEVMKDQIMELPRYTDIELIRYTVIPKNNRLFDISNVASIVDKFFCDALVELGKLPDDNYKYIHHIRYAVESPDPKNYGVKIYIVGEIKNEIKD